MSALLCLSACGEPGTEDPDPNNPGTPGTQAREPGFGPEDKALWWVDSATYATDSCANWAEWTRGLDDFRNVLGNTYVAFGGNAEGSVDLLRCTTPGQLDSCAPRSPPVRYEADGVEYSRSFEEPMPLQDFACTIMLNFDVVLTDAGSSLVERLTRTHTLTGPDCEAFEQTIIEESSNGFGISGCTVTFTSLMSLKDWSPR